ncbi:hypothetical protein PENSPDRAFT_657343 [Peniophora sp. CONT]|nr:hypothetical protein PENSPDRAFT_657343 [Peniophora sp. CONT]
MPLQQLGYQVSLYSDGVEIPAYKVENINDNTVTCYIPSDAGKEFTVKFRNEQVVGYGAAFYTHMDGREMQGLSVYPYESTTMKGVYETLSSIRPFEFARLKLKEDDGDGGETSVDMAKLGLIEVRVCRATLIPNEFGAGEYRPHRVQAELDAVSEKAKKVGWHSVSLGRTKPLAIAANVPHITYIDPKDRPYATFRFRYQPRELLEDQGIIPARPRSATLTSPGPSSGKRPRRDDLSDRPHKRHASVKAEPGPSARVKREAEVVDLTGRREPSPIRVPEGAQGEVIDLTDD